MKIRSKNGKKLTPKRYCRVKLSRISTKMYDMKHLSDSNKITSKIKGKGFKPLPKSPLSLDSSNDQYTSKESAIEDFETQETTEKLEPNTKMKAPVSTKGVIF